jgi:protein-tyrosine phosphatase
MTLAGAPNFRDIGGCAAAAGRTVRRGRIFRSQVLTDATEHDLELIRQLGIGAVLDLRDPEERRRPNRWPHAMPVQAVSVDARPPADGIRTAQLRRWLQDPGFEESRARSLVMGMYREMPRAYAPHLASLFALLAEPLAPPVLIHCEAGKDRTGFVCAILLLALEAPVQAVLAEYLLSRGRYRVSALRKVVDEDLPPRADRALSVIAAVEADYLNAALHRIDARYGSLEAYLREGVGVTREQLRAVRSNLLEQRCASSSARSETPTDVPRCAK